VGAFSLVEESPSGSWINYTRQSQAAFLATRSGYTVRQSTLGVVTYYHPSLHEELMANGEPYDRFNPTMAASPFFPLGTRLRVTRLDTGASIVVTVSDRAPPSGWMWVDLSEAAFQMLAPLSVGRLTVKIEVLEPL